MKNRIVQSTNATAVVGALLTAFLLLLSSSSSPYANGFVTSDIRSAVRLSGTASSPALLAEQQQERRRSNNNSGSSNYRGNNNNNRRFNRNDSRGGRQGGGGLVLNNPMKVRRIPVEPAPREAVAQTRGYNNNSRNNNQRSPRVVEISDDGVIRQNSKNARDSSEYDGDIDDEQRWSRKSNARRGGYDGDDAGGYFYLTMLRCSCHSFFIFSKMHDWFVARLMFCPFVQ